MKEKLVNRSLAAWQRAIQHYLDHEQDQFVMQAAICFELLGKARLSAIHPSLIVDRDFDSFLHVCEESKHAIRPPWSIRTINATEVLKRCCQLHHSLKDFAANLGLLAECRNSAIHLGEIVKEKERELFHDFIASTSLLADALGIPRQQFFGEYAGLVDTHLNESLTEVNRLTAEKLALAKTDYNKKYGSHHLEQAEFLIASVENAYDLRKYEDQLSECPACGNRGVLSGSIDVEWQADFDRDGEPEGAYPEVTLTPSYFVCDLCGLELDGSAEVKAAGFEEAIRVNDVDPSDFYDEPDYEY